MDLKTKRKLARAVLFRFGIGLTLLAVIFFLSAGTFEYWQVWILLAILFIPMLMVLLYFIKEDPELLERRMKLKERKKSQKLCVTLATPIFLLSLIIPGLDQRFHWSSVPIPLVIIADIFVLLGYIIIFLVFRENSYASRVVDVEKYQKVISSGPYALVRHPMYVGVILMYGLSPLALGSFWAVIPALIAPIVIVIRIFDEEKLLKAKLPGYMEYTQKVKYRIIPKIW